MLIPIFVGFTWFPIGTESTALVTSIASGIAES
jgi:hypothetical protein